MIIIKLTQYSLIYCPYILTWYIFWDQWSQIIGPGMCKKRCLCSRWCLFSSQGSTDQNWSVKILDSRTTEERSRAISDQDQRKIWNFGPNQTKKQIKKISDQLGPNGPRTKRSIDLCFERLFGDGPVGFGFDSNLLKLHWNLKSNHLSLESIWVIPYK